MLKILTAALIITFYSNGIYDFNVPKMEGGIQELSVYTNKRLLIVTLPVIQTPSADSFLYSLDTIASAHLASHKVIAVPSFENGFETSKRDSLLNWYRSKLGNEILLTDGLYTHKSTGTQQHNLFKFLSNVTLNGIFDISPNEPGYQFFVMGDGRLYGIFQPITKIWSTSVYRALTVETQQ